MASITREQIDKINARCSNNWKFDTRRFVMWSGEKSLRKIIKQDEQHYLEISLYFSERYERFSKVGLEISMNISRWTAKGDGMATSSGLGIFRRIPYSKARRSLADLEKLTAVIDDDYIMNIYNNGDNAEKCLDNVLLDADGWHIHNV